MQSNPTIANTAEAFSVKPILFSTPMVEAIAAQVVDYTLVKILVVSCFKIAHNGSRLGEVVDFKKLSLKFITNVK